MKRDRLRCTQDYSRVEQLLDDPDRLREFCEAAQYIPKSEGAKDQAKSVDLPLMRRINAIRAFRACPGAFARVGPVENQKKSRYLPHKVDWPSPLGSSARGQPGPQIVEKALEKACDKKEDISKWVDAFFAVGAMATVPARWSRCLMRLRPGKHTNMMAPSRDALNETPLQASRDGAGR